MRALRRSSLFVAALAATLLPGLADAATLSGQVKDPSGQPLSNVQVVVPALQKGAKTDASGSYKIEGLPAGSYAVEFRPLGYAPATRRADLSQGDATVDVAVTGSPLSTRTACTVQRASVVDHSMRSTFTLKRTCRARSWSVTVRCR